MVFKCVKISNVAHFSVAKKLDTEIELSLQGRQAIEERETQTLKHN